MTRQTAWRGSARAGLAALLAGALGCGTAVYRHRIEVTVSGAPTGSAEVSVFDLQMGSTRDWAHRTLGPSGPGRPYVGSFTTTPAVTVGTMDDARPLAVAIALPELTEFGYFLLLVDRPLREERVEARYASYEPSFPLPRGTSIPVVATAAAEKGAWDVRLTVEFGAARAALTGTPESSPAGGGR